MPSLISDTKFEKPRYAEYPLNFISFKGSVYGEVGCSYVRDKCWARGACRGQLLETVSFDDIFCSLGLEPKALIFYCRARTKVICIVMMTILIPLNTYLFCWLFQSASEGIESCQDLCHNTKNCKWFTFNSLSHKCLLHSTCDSIDKTFHHFTSNGIDCKGKTGMKIIHRFYPFDSNWAIWKELIAKFFQLYFQLTHCSTFVR